MIETKKSEEFSFPTHLRIKKGADFERAYRRMRPVQDRLMKLFACENGLGYCRLGLSVGRRYGNAVRRNRAKRVLREAFRLSRQSVSGQFDYVLIPRPGQDLRLPETIDCFVKLAGAATRRLRRAEP